MSDVMKRPHILHPALSPAQGGAKRQSNQRHENGSIAYFIGGQNGSNFLKGNVTVEKLGYGVSDVVIGGQRSQVLDFHVQAVLLEDVLAILEFDRPPNLDMHERYAEAEKNDPK